MKSLWKNISIMRHFSALVLAVVMVTCTVTGCNSFRSGSGSMDEAEPLKVVATIFPGYDWVREILGENSSDVELTLLLSNGTDMHSYQPSVDDIVTISECDIFVYVGGESDSWVDAVLNEAANEEMKVVNFMEILGENVIEEETVPGMESGNEEEESLKESADTGDAEGGDSADNTLEDTENDEHVWLSVKNAEVCCEAIAGALSDADPENEKLYEANLESYREELKSLDAGYESVVENGSYDTLVFADRFPFLYLVKDYGINYYAAFSGCSAETEASFETITFLAEKVEELGISTILVTESSDGKLAETVAENTASGSYEIATMNSMQSITQKQADTMTYLSVMDDNLDVLEEALG